MLKLNATLNVVGESRAPFNFNIQRSSLDPAVMGILNITPDSFSDGGVHFDQSKAVHAALQMEEDGAAIIDIGGESTRPGAEPLAAQVEIDRVVPVIEQIRQRSDVPISIDTRKAAVAEEAIAAGREHRQRRQRAALLGRDAGGRGEGSGVPVILMHMRGEPAHDAAAHATTTTSCSDVARELTSMRRRCASPPASIASRSSSIPASASPRRSSTTSSCSRAATS